MAKAALLDVDGALVDTNYHRALAWYRAFREHGIALPVWRIHRHIGMGGDQLVPRPRAGNRAGRPRGDRGDESLPIGEVQAFEEAHGLNRGSVGDTKWDVESARKAGIETICVMAGGWSRQELLDAGAAAVFESVGELRGKLDETPLSFS